MRKVSKNIIALVVVLTTVLNISIESFAQDPFTAIAIGGLNGASGAGLFSSMAGISGVDISWGNNTSDPIDAMWNVLNPDHVYYSGEKHEATMVDEDVYDYIDVDIGDWLSGQSDFIVKMINELDIQDNDSGQFNVNTSIHGIEFVNGWAGPFAVYPSDRYEAFDLTVGPYRIVGRGLVFDYYFNGTMIGTASSSVYMGRDLYLRYVGGFVAWGQKYNYNQYANLEQVTLEPATTVDWSSDTVDTHVFDGWENARVKIPHSISGLSSNWDIPEFLGAINTIWENHQQGQIVIEDTDQPVPPPPIPSTSLGEVPFDDWIDLWGQGIYEQLENQSDSLDLIGSNGEDQIEELESIDSNLDDLNQTAESIDTNIGIGNGILGGIRSLAQSAVNFLEGIAEHVEELVEEIVEGTETLIAGILNQIPQAFGVIFGPIKQASSIWHYVVEWIQSIGAPFQFIWSMASGTSYYIILPVYASLAAAVVLAFYKRFGK